MTRLPPTLLNDVRLQFRHGFYYAAAFAAVVMILIARQIPTDALPQLLPVLVMGNMTINTFYFVAALVLLEKEDGVLEGLVVTPLRRDEYLWAKLITLVFLTVVENLFIVIFVYGLHFNILLLVGGIILLGLFNALYGFILVVRYDSLNSFLFPSVFLTMALSIPLLDYFGIWTTPLMLLHPVQASLFLLKGAFQPIAPWQIVYGALYALLWIGILHLLAKRVFYRFIILKQGVRP